MTHYTARVIDDRRLELPQGALRLVRPGQVIEIEVDDSPPPPISKPNEAALAMLHDVQDMTKYMPETDPSKTNRLIREARSGGIYGCEPTE